MENEDENELQFNNIKVILLGNSGVGKTSLINIVTGGKFDENENITVTAFYAMKKIRCKKQDYILNIWDTTGQEKLRQLTKIFYTNSKIVIFVYDITNKESFTDLNYWVNDIKERLGDNYMKGVVANKADLFLNEVVKKEEGEEYATSINAKFLDFSAKEDHPSKFESFLVDLLVEYLKNSGRNIIDDSFSLNRKRPRKSRREKNCC